MPGLLASSLMVGLLLAGADVPAPPAVTRGLLPKEETGALRFLEQHADFDGRGTVVAIFDTGVDPGAAGLQKTSDGRPKVIDLVDGTGSGDVNTSTVRRSENGTIAGLSGRDLKVDPSWTNPTGEFHVGIKRGYDLFPDDLTARLKQQRRKEFDRAQQHTEQRLREKAHQWDETHADPSPGEQRMRDDLDEQLKQLSAAGKSFEDSGPLYDCVVFHDGQKWRAVVDTDEDGDLTDEDALTNFRDERQFDTFDNDSLLNFGVNIYDDGNLLSIVTDCGAHGTHVAGIVSAFYPNQPELNGVAPGAQIVSVKIGHPHLHGMETGTGLIRGLNAVLRNKCDLINMSYGEPTATPDRGRLVEAFSEVVRKHGVIFVCSAGNAGPALSTVGAPGGTTSALLGVGAYVSPQMMKAQYTLRDPYDGLPYTWTSRGPTVDGHQGVAIFAPGGAIAPVPGWTLRPSVRMNGTSMASPNTCGSLALLLSGLKHEGLPYSPWSVRRAIQNSARQLDGVEPWAQGPGLLQVEAAWEHLNTHAAATGEQLEFRVELPGRSRGIYLRDSFESDEEYTTSVRILPVFPDVDDRRPQRDFSMRMNLKVLGGTDYESEGAGSRVEVGEFLMLNSGGGQFEVRIDPAGTPPGTAEFHEIVAYDADHPERGPLARVPITIVHAEPADAAPDDFVEFEPGRLHRRFLVVPDGATWADIRLERGELSPSLNSESDRRYVLHSLQLLPGESYRAADDRRYLTLADRQTRVLSRPVVPGHTLEVCLAQYWTSLGPSRVRMHVSFHGARPEPSEVLLDATDPVRRIELSAELGDERLSPSASLTTRRTIVHPASAELRPLSSARDRLPDGRQPYELLLTYKFEQTDRDTGSGNSGRVTPRLPLNDDLLYDSPLGSQLWKVFDEHGRRVATDDIYPEAFRLGRGKYELVVHLRSPDPSRLERLKAASICLDRPLASPVSVSVHRDKPAAQLKTDAVGSMTLKRGQRTAVYLAAPLPSKLPKGLATGEQLIGSVSWGRADAAQDGSGQRPDGYPIVYVHSAAPAGKSASKSGESKADAEAEADERAAMIAELHKLDTLEDRKKHLPKVVAAADAVIATIDEDRLATELGRRANPEDSEASDRRKKIERMRDDLVDALYRKGRALGYMELPDVIAEHPIADPEQHDRDFEANFAELRKWVDTTEKDYVLLHIRRERRHKRFGNALKLLNELIAKSPSNYWHFKKRRDIYEQLGWTHLHDNARRWLTIRFPDEREGF